MNTNTYTPNLTGRQLDRTLDGLLACRRSCEWLLCRYLADIADERRFREVGWYADVLHYADKRHELGVKSTRERIRIGRALRELPKIEQAFVRGELSYSKVRELTRVADRDTEPGWLDLARMTGMRELERRVSSVARDEAKPNESAEVRWRTPATVELRMGLSAEAWALLSRAIEAAKLASETGLSDSEAIESVAREALCRMTETESDPATAADPRKAVVLYTCQHCEQTELETTAGAVGLPPAAAERLGCGARVVDLERDGWQERFDGAIPAPIRRVVLARDRGRCQCCGRRRYVDLHHIVPVSRGGKHSRANLTVVCSACHTAIHEGELRVEGDAESGLEWLDGSGEPLAPWRGRPSAEAEQRQDEVLSAEASRVLTTMANRGGWLVDGLIAATGLSVSEVAAGLTELELAGRVTSVSGLLSPVGASLSKPAEAGPPRRRAMPRLGHAPIGPFAKQGPGQWAERQTGQPMHTQ